MMWVLKLGGSLMHRPALADWQRALRTGGGKLLVVPGGGAYADRVRDSQARLGLSDAEAHRRALHAMHRYGTLLSRSLGLVQTATLTGIRHTLYTGRTPLWSPLRMAHTWHTLPRDWGTSSDSLALYLAGLLGADGLILAKRPRPQPVPPPDLVDTYFPVLWARLRHRPPVYWLGEHGHTSLRRALRTQGVPPGQPLPGLPNPPRIHRGRRSPAALRAV